MSYIQRRIPEPNKIYEISLTNFSGGLNNKSDELIDNESPDLLNMAFSNNNIMEKRKGQKYYGGVNYGKPITFIDVYKQFEAKETELSIWGTFKWGDVWNANGDFLITATDSEIYVDGSKLAEINSDINGVTYQGNYFYADGEKLMVYGKFPYEESSYLDIIGTIPGGNALLQIVSPPEGYTPLDDITEADSETGEDVVIGKHIQGKLCVDYNEKKIWYEPCLFEIEDNYKGANVIPSSVKYLVNHKGRIFASGDKLDDDNIFITDVGNPYYFCVSLPMQLPPNSDKVLGMLTYDDSLVIGRHHDVYIITGTTNRLDAGLELFNLKRLNTHTGFASPRCFNHVHNYILFLGSDKVAYAISSIRDNDSVLSTSIISKQIDLTKDPINITNISDAVTIWHNDNWYVSVGDKTLVYSYQNRVWTLYSGIDAKSYCIINYQLVWGNTQGQMATFSDDYLDFGKPYISYWKSKHFDFDEPANDKHYRRIIVLTDVYDEFDSVVNVKTLIDYYDTNDKYVIENRVSRWGNLMWGDRYISRNIKESQPFRINRRGRRIQFVLFNGYNLNDEVMWLGNLYNYPNKKDGTVVYVINEDKYFIYNSLSTNLYHKNTGIGWELIDEKEFNQPMKFYEITCNYEMRIRK